MTNSLNKTSIPVASSHKTKLDLSCEHLTTMNFMLPQPVFYRHMIAGEHLTFDCLANVRPAPISVPLYGKMRMNLRGFFVPYRLCMPNWHSFKQDVVASNYSTSSLVSDVPVFYPSTLTQLFVNSFTSAGSASAYDFLVGGIYYLYTPLGRRLIKLLESLGYKMIPTASNKVSPYNAFALLAFLKVHLDWYANSQYLDDAIYLQLSRLLEFNDPASRLILSQSDLFSILNFVAFCCYDNEQYYTNAWDNPVMPNSGQGTPITSLTDPTVSFASAAYIGSTGSYNTPTMISSGTYVGTEYIHSALKKITDYQKRHSLAGALAIDRALAANGFVTDSLKLKRCIYVGSQSLDIDTGAVMSQSDTSGASLGDYAGAGFGKGSKSWDFTCDEEGIFIVISSIQPQAQFYQGYDRMNMLTNKLDFFTPELDGLGCQPIQKGEVYVSKNDTFMTGTDSYAQGIFGFAGAFGQYKRPKSFVTGDFSNENIMPGGSAWHLFRRFDDSYFTNSDGIVHSLSFTRTDVDWMDYNRIFQYTGSDRDPFYCFFHFDVAAFAPCKPLFDTYEFDDDNQRVTLDSNGAKVN